jgi:hypothetical protein
MTLLSPVIRKGGFELTMITRVGRSAAYRQHLPGGNPDHEAFEVILPQTRTTNHKGEPVEPYESYPAAESWGKKAWTFTSLAKAFQKAYIPADVVSKVAPTDHHQNNASLFNLARLVKGYEHAIGRIASAEELEFVFDCWSHVAHPFWRPELKRDDYYAEFHLGLAAAICHSTDAVLVALDVASAALSPNYNRQ